MRRGRRTDCSTRLVGPQHAASPTRLNKTANGSARTEPPEPRIASEIAPGPQVLELQGRQKRTTVRERQQGDSGQAHHVVPLDFPYLLMEGDIIVPFHRTSLRELRVFSVGWTKKPIPERWMLC